MWDATCPDTFAPCHTTYVAAGEVAALAEERMCTKYTSLPATPSFTLVAMETSGAIGPESLELLKELGRRVRRHTGDEQAVSYLLQRIFVIQRGNAASFLRGLNGNTHTHIYIYVTRYEKTDHIAKKTKSRKPRRSKNR